MVDLVQTLIGYGMVLIAALYVGWKFMPSNLRTWLTPRMAACMRRRGVAAERVIWLEAKLSGGGACGTCAACAKGKRVVGCAALSDAQHANTDCEN